MILIKDFIKEFPFRMFENESPWHVTGNLINALSELITTLDDSFVVTNGVAIHKTATVEPGVNLKAPVIISENCFVGANACLRGGVFLAEYVVIGPSSEIKSSVICSGSRVAHLNFIGDSIIGNDVNFEAGSVTANYHNDRTDKRIYVFFESATYDTVVEKFGSLVGDHCRIGANAVLSPGTILMPETIVKRLQLIEQHRVH